MPAKKTTTGGQGAGAPRRGATPPRTPRKAKSGAATKKTVAKKTTAAKPTKAEQNAAAAARASTRDGAKPTKAEAPKTEKKPAGRAVARPVTRVVRRETATVERARREPRPKREKKEARRLPPAPEGAGRKWARDWANVREWRAVGTVVVHVLPPGEAVLVGDRQAGWWAVYQDSRVLGYVAGWVLGDQPAAAPPDSGRGRGIGG